MASGRSMEIESVVRGYHVYMEFWDPSIGDTFLLETEPTNIHDRYAVAVKVDGSIVGHVPKELSKTFYYFIRNGGVISGEVCGRRQRSSVPMKGLEIPCNFKFTSNSIKLVKKLKHLLERQDISTT